MRVSSILITLAAVCGLSAAAPASTLEARQSQCSNPAARKEWRSLTLLERANYILSVKCLMHKPSSMKSTFPYSTSRWEDFVSIHKAETPKVHYVGQFLPWHRMYLANFEKALREECFYLGRLPYWDQSLDIADFTASPIFNDWIGFGGNGVDEGGDPIIPGSTGGGCIGSGLFRNHRTHIDYADRDTPGINRCIKRAIAPMIASLWQTQAKLDLVLAEPTYEEMAVTLEGDVEFPDPLPKMGMHNSGHTTIGGDMTDMFVSPGDPIFWLHHANIDRIWALWQAQDSARQYAVGNPIAPRPNPMLVWPDAPSGNVTPAFPLVRLKVPGTSTQALVGHVLNTVGKGVTVPGTNIVGELCYQYV